MINRVLSLIEETHGTPQNPWYIPAASQFPSAWKVSYEDGYVYVVYLPAEHRRHKHSMFLFRHSAGLYAAYGDKSAIENLGAKNVVSYCKQPTHAWRCFVADGTDSATDPMTGLPVGAVTGRFIKLQNQPPVVVNKANPLVVETFSITKLEPAIPLTCGPISMVGNTKKEIDELNGIASFSTKG